MTPKRNPSYLFKTPRGIYYFRVRIPVFIRKKYGTTRKEIRSSLHTRDISVAQKRARQLWVFMEASDFKMKDSDREFQEANDGRKLLKEYLVADMESDDGSYLRDYDEELSVEAFVGGLSPEGIDLLNKELDDWNNLAQEKRNTILESLKNEVNQKVGKENLPEPKNAVHISGNNCLSTALVSDKIVEFIEYHLERRSRSGKPAPKSTVDEFKGIYREFISIIGCDLRCCDLNREIMIHYEKAILKIPANHSRKPQYKKMAMEKLLEIEIPEKEKRSVGTYNKHVLRVSQFLKWSGRVGFTEPGLENFIEKLPDNVKKNAKRVLFTSDELILLFNNEIYEKGKFKHPSRYWLPLLALFTGARGEELAQLYGDDIGKDKDTGIYFLKMRENKDRMQNLKNLAAHRIIPIHQKLITLGFLDFVENSTANSMLFPDCENKHGDNFKNFGNNFNRHDPPGWKIKHGVTRDKTCFHSFRHIFIDFFAKSKVPQRISCSFVGHTYKGEGLVLNYIKPDEIKVLQKAVNSLSFPSINWRKIRRMKW